MHNNKSLMKLISYFLPESSKILEVGEDYKVLAILEGDIDKDEQEEVITLYNRENRNYLMILKKFGRKWSVIWNNRIEYTTINKFQLATLTREYKQIVIGGKIGECEAYKLRIFNWKQDNLHQMEGEPITFDKIYIEDVDGKDGLDEIALWKHKELEVYDVDIYRYHENQLIVDNALDPYYFKTVANYYQYLHENYQDEPIYEEYLEQAKRRCGIIEDNKEVSYKAKALKGGYIKKNKIEDTMELEYNLAEMLVGTTGYTQEFDVEEDIYLCGKKDMQGGRTCFNNLKLIVTRNAKTNYQIVPLEKMGVYDYQVFVGDFCGEGLEYIWVGVDKGRQKENWYIGIYKVENNHMQQIFDSRKWQYQGSRVIQIYPVDRQIKGEFEICYLEEFENLEKLMTWVRWERSELKPYKKYRIEEVKDKY